MDGGSFAKSIASRYKKGGGGDAAADAETEEPTADAGADSDDDSAKEAAGSELADAIKSGDGMEIYRAFEALNTLCSEG